MNRTATMKRLMVPMFFVAGFAMGGGAFVPPQYVGDASALRSVTNRAFTGIPSVAVAAKGRLWATWYAGPTPNEDSNNYVVLSTSGDGGVSWKEILVVDPDGTGPRRTFDPQLWIAPDGKLRWTWTDRFHGPRFVGNQGSWPDRDNYPEDDGLWMMVLDDPNSETTVWQPPVCVARGVMMGKPLALSTGEWVFPVCVWFADVSSQMVVSTDKGKTWTIRGGAGMPYEDRLFDEQALLERKDGSILEMARTKTGIRESVSSDRGKTWSQLVPSQVKHTSARFFLRRLNSGNVLLVKHGPLYKDVGRSQLTAYLSKDDGATWEGGLMLDERLGVSYPDGQQTADDVIRIIYDYDRTGARQILMASFREEDVMSGKTDSPTVGLRRLVSQGSGGRQKSAK